MGRRSSRKAQQAHHQPTKALGQYSLQDVSSEQVQPSNIGDSISRPHRRHHIATKDSGKTTRISLACIACRSRKHKCSGEKPRCAQCISNNIACEWPTRQKRGPPKEYMHNLEARLLETETVLHALLSQVSAEQLQASFQRIQPSKMSQARLQDHSMEESDTPTTIRHDRCGSSHWNAFPLDSPENLRRWWKNRAYELNERTFSPALERDQETAPTVDESLLIDSLPMPMATVPRDTESFRPATLVNQYSDLESLDPQLQHSISDADFGSENTCGTSSPIVQHESLSGIQRRSSRGGGETDDILPQLSEQREGVLQFSKEFKHDFIW